MRLSDEIIINGNRAYARSYAKINLTLDVLNKREDGYHNVSMVMQTVNLCDMVTVEKNEKEITLVTNLNYLPLGEKNIAWKAAKIFFEECQIKGGARIDIQKNIPVAAGLAGGSSNAAAVLCALNILYDVNLSDEELCKIGVKLGADVPYCIIGGTQLAEGIGEKLSPVAEMPKTTVLLVKPPISISTAKIYEKIDSHDIVHPDTVGMIESIKKADINQISKRIHNVMEPVTADIAPVVLRIKEKMIKDGALAAAMSGSGPTVFGIFDDEIAAKKSCDSFFTFYKEVYLTKTYN